MMTGNGLDGVFLDFFGTLADGDRRTVEAVCASVVDRLGLPTSAPEFAEMWSRHFFEAIETSNHDAFRTPGSSPRLRTIWARPRTPRSTAGKRRSCRR